ncbi:MAG: hypothetical protein OXL41_07715 [Nitrospinae bacterium]|nr:hypothetical protein [Nitrospinota bacterium]
MRNKNRFAQKAFSVLLSLALLLPGCGGGGGGSGRRVPDVFHNAAHVVAGPNQTIEDARQAPAIDFDGTLHIGAGVEPDRDQLGTTGEHGDAAVSSGHVRDGAGRDAMVVFFSQFFTDRKRLRTFRAQPVVRVARGTSAAHTDLVVRAVQILNAYLPRENRMIFSEIPSPYGADLVDVPRGEIHVNFGPFGEQIPENFRTYRGFASTATTGGGIIAIASRIWINSNRLHQFTYEAGISLLAHELMHSLALGGHPDAARYPLSFIRHRSPRGFSRRILGPIDRDVIAAAFEYAPEATSANELGPWSDTSFHLRGDVDDVSFGVASFNGLLQPWASGPTPSVDLAHNTELSGSASWSGRLLGFTSESQSLAGAADLTINFETLRGQIDFTGLEHWGVNATPGPVGSGQTWNDGDLRYSVIVRKNTFIQTGGDAGEVTGAFFGPNHEGMGGVVERSDMSAGFGGTR